MTAGLPATPALSTRAVTLRPLLPSDGEWCYALMCGPAGASWRYRGRTPSPDMVAADLWRGVLAQFVVTDARDGRPAGLVGLYNASTDAGRAHAFAVADPSAAPLVVEGFGLLCAWGFEHFSLQRIFIEAPEFNVAKFASLGDAAIVEGRLRNYEFWQGRYWDLLIMSITPEAFDQRFGSLVAARRAINISDPSAEVLEFQQLVEELWPLDSLGLVEVLCALEEVVGSPVGPEVVEGLDTTSASAFATALVGRVERSRGDQSGVGQQRETAGSTV